MPFIEERREFIERQGCEYVLVDNRLVFANGAVWYDGSFGMQAGSEPPDDGVALAQLRCQFLATKLANKKQSLGNLRNMVATQAEYYARGCGPHPDNHFPDWREQLQKLTDEVATLQTDLTTMTQALPRSERSTVYDLRRDHERMGAAQVLQDLNNISR